MTAPELKPLCELCNGAGFYGDNGPGQKGNREYVQCDCTKPKQMTTPAPELKPAGEWQEYIVLTSRRGTDHVIRLNTYLVRRIQDDAIRWAADAINEISNQDSPRLGLREKLLKRWDEIR